MKDWLSAALIFAVAALSARGADAITRIWLTHQVSDASTLTVNWETESPGPSRVDYGPSESLGSSAKGSSTDALHHVEVPFPSSGTLYYRVTTGTLQSATHPVKTYSGDTLRIAATANWYLYPALDSLLADEPHLLLSCGDSVPGVLEQESDGDAPNTAPFSFLIDRYPALFARVPYLPALGNHDRQIRVLDAMPDDSPFYDLEARAFRSFFPLPDDGRIYHVDLPAFNLRLAALDTSHLQDMGTPRQSCLAADRSSEQFRWYRDLTRSRAQRFMITYYNEYSGGMRALERGEWNKLLRQNSVLLSGFGSYGERAEVAGTPYFNAALKADPAWPDTQNGKFFDATETYLLVRVPRDGERVSVDIKRLDGTVLDSSDWPGRAKLGNRR